MRKSTQQKCAAVLASLLSLPAAAVTSGPGTRPHPEDFPSYSLYLQALFDYQRAQSPASVKAAPVIAENQPTPESLEEAIANAGSNPGYVDTSSHPRSTFKSFALAQIPSQDMSQNSVANALGTFDNHGMEQPPKTTARLRADSDLNLVPDVSMRLIGDVYDTLWKENSYMVVENFSGHILLPEGEAWVESSAVSHPETRSLSLTLSSRVRSNVYIIDRDGMPGTYYDKAGVVAIQPLALEISNLTSSISAARNNNNDDVLAIQSSTNRPITLDLSGSRFGTASASQSTGSIALDRRHVGPIRYFAGFGDNAMVTIAPGTRLDIRIGHPNGMIRPLATVKGIIPTLSLENFYLLSQSSSGGEEEIGMSIGKMELTGLEISNLRLFVNNTTFVIDIGTSPRDLTLGLERIAAGSNQETAIIGDVYLEHARINSSRISIAAH